MGMGDDEGTGGLSLVGAPILLTNGTTPSICLINLVINYSGKKIKLLNDFLHTGLLFY